MTWQSKIMPDDALDPASLVGVMRNSKPTSNHPQIRSSTPAPDFRALIEEITNVADYWVSPYPGREDVWNDLIERARTALEVKP